MALRYDFVQVSAPRIDSKTGILRCRGTIARTGVQDYRNSDGTVRRELRPADEVEKSAKSFEAQPITLEHPPEMVNARNSRNYMRGLTGTVAFDGALLTTELTVTDQEAVDSAQTTHKQLSNGYECDIDETPGTWEGQRYDCIQRNIRGNHVALVKQARAGEMAKLHLDSSDSLPSDYAVAIHQDSEEIPEIPAVCVTDAAIGNTKAHIPLTNPTNKHRPRMANLRIDSVEYADIPEAAATQMSNKLQQLVTATARADALESKLDAATKQAQDFEDQLETVTADKERERGRADGLEIQVEDLTYQIESKGEEKTDGEDDEEVVRVDDDDILTAIAQGIEQGISSRIEAYEVLEQHGVDIGEVEFDSSLTPAQVQETVLQLVQPGVTYDSVDDSVRHVYIQARYDALKSTVAAVEAEERNDAAGYVAGAKGSITAARQKQFGKGDGELDDGSKAKMDAFKRPLSMSKKVGC